MKTESERIQGLLKDSWSGDMWHGANLAQILKDISWQKAFEKPSAGSHNIYELVSHMYTWRHFVVEQLKGHEAYKVALNSEVDWPTIYEHTEKSWKDILHKLEKSQAELEELLAHITDAKLEEVVAGRKFTWYTLLHGLLHHDIYHSAQIATLKK